MEAAHCETRNRLAANKWLATEIADTDRNKVLCAYITTRVCVCLANYTNVIRDRAVQRISATFLTRTKACSKTLNNQHSRSKPPTPYRNDLNYEPLRYSCPAYMARRASRVVRAAWGPVCLVEHHTGRNKVLICNLTNTKRIRGGG